MTQVSITDVAVLRDHLRLPWAALDVLRESTQALAGFRFASEGHGWLSFAKHRKVAEVACMSLRTYRRAINDVLVPEGYLIRYGREARRTVTYGFSNRADALFQERFIMLPRAIVQAVAATDSPLSWAERCCLAAVVSNHSLCLMIEEQGCAESRRLSSITEFMAETRLCRRSVINGRRGLLDRGLVELDQLDGYVLNEFYTISEKHLVRACDVLARTDNESLPQRLPESLPEAFDPSANVATEGVHLLSQRECISCNTPVHLLSPPSAFVATAVSESSNQSSSTSSESISLGHRQRQALTPPVADKAKELSSPEYKQGERLAMLELRGWKGLTKEDQVTYSALESPEAKLEFWFATEASKS